jgi:hypothetical protein
VFGAALRFSGKGAMKIHTVPGVKGNFGDDLNGWMWRRLAPELFTSDDGVLFVGIGTILDDKLPRADVRVVFGSGAGYGRLPIDITRSPKWAVYGVRGKLTAKVLGLSDDLAATDPAILISTFAELHAANGRQTIFVPHWKTTRYGCWHEVCRACQIKLVDPCQDSVVVIREIASANKVIAESMHAAIIADSFRVPWVPVVLSREVSAFKWCDWASSLGVPYQPRCMPPSSPVEVLRDRMLATTRAAGIRNYPTLEQQRAAIAVDFADDDEVIADFMTNVGGAETKDSGLHHKLVEILLKRVSLLEQKLTPRLARIGDRWFDDACRAMTSAGNGRAFLSDDKNHREALADTLTRLERVRRDRCGAVHGQRRA